MTLTDDDSNSIQLMMPLGQFGVDGCHLDGGRAQCGLGDHQGGRQGGGTGVAQNIGAGVLVSCDHDDDNMCCWNMEITVVMVTREWRKD